MGEFRNQGSRAHAVNNRKNNHEIRAIRTPVLHRQQQKAGGRCHHRFRQGKQCRSSWNHAHSEHQFHLRSVQGS